VEQSRSRRIGERLDRELEMLDDDDAGGERGIEQRDRRRTPDEAIPAAFLQKIVQLAWMSARQDQGDGESVMLRFYSAARLAITPSKENAGDRPRFHQAAFASAASWIIR